MKKRIKSIEEMNAMEFREYTSSHTPEVKSYIKKRKANIRAHNLVAKIRRKKK